MEKENIEETNIIEKNHQLNSDTIGENTQEQIESLKPSILDSNKLEVQSQTPYQNEHSDQSFIELKLLSYNIFIRPPPINTGNDYKTARLKLFKEHLKKYDIINFQEMFGTFSNRRKKLINTAHKKGLLFANYGPKPRVLSTFVIDSGLLSLSKYKIVRQDFMYFTDKNGVDGFAQKGLLYSKIELPGGKHLHLFNTHLQATYATNYDLPNKSNYVARLNQITKLREMIYSMISKHNPAFELYKPFEEVILFGGDFNVNANSTGGFPTDLKLKSKEAMEFLTRTSSKTMNQYSFLIAALSGFGTDIIVDLNAKSFEGHHPPTFAMFISHQAGVGQKYVKGTPVVQGDDYTQGLDYWFQIIPFGIKLYEIESEVKIERFEVETPTSGFTNLSDHYGVELSIKVRL